MSAGWVTAIDGTGHRAPMMAGLGGASIAVSRGNRLVGLIAFLLMLVIAGYPGQAAVLEVGAGGEVARRDAAPATPAPSLTGEQLAAQAVTPVAPPSMPLRFSGSVQAAAAAAGISPHLLAAVVWQESRWQPAAVSHAGAIGIAQLMPATARALAVDPRDPSASLFASARLLRHELDRFGGRIELALAAYNAGPARVARAGAVPPIAETQAYVAAILDRLARIS